MYMSVIRDPGGPQTVRLLSSTTIVDGSILLVPANTVAFFVCNGQVSEPYRPGRWEIRTGVGPFFVRLRNLMTQGDPGIVCQVWYVNICQENYKSGGTGDLIFQEQRFHISMKGRAAYTIRYVVSDPLKLITKLIGMHHNAFENEDIQPVIDAMILPHIKQSLINYISNCSIHAFQNELVSIGNEIRGLLREELLNYGLNLISVAITAINIPDEEFRRLNALEEKYASGTVATDVELDNVKRIYGSVENRTLTEMVTGSVRGAEAPVSRETNGIAGMIAALPLQMSIANQMVNQMAGTFSGVLNNGNSRNSSEEQPSADNSSHTPPDLPIRPRVCTSCGRSLDDSDIFCRYCGNRL